jgi:alanine-alpha-ketoisovalerate/valine-pyruvate aminotransferase
MHKFTQVIRNIRTFVISLFHPSPQQREIMRLAENADDETLDQIIAVLEDAVKKKYK